MTAKIMLTLALGFSLAVNFVPVSALCLLAIIIVLWRGRHDHVAETP